MAKMADLNEDVVLKIEGIGTKRFEKYGKLLLETYEKRIAG
jgi:hypothetical protein